MPCDVTKIPFCRPPPTCHLEINVLDQVEKQIQS